MKKDLLINNLFIETWHPKYDCLEHDEGKYQDLLRRVENEMLVYQSINMDTFRDIYMWKSHRTVNKVDWNNFAKYTETFKQLFFVDIDTKVDMLINLPGIGIPVASTILHYIYPNQIPIVDIRTVEFLLYAGYLDNSKNLGFYRDSISGYSEFRNTFEAISFELPNWNYRQIDRAIFTYHKYNLGKK